MAGSKSGRGFPVSVRGVVDVIFGRWPAWPWSVVLLIAAGGIAGAAVAPALRAWAPDRAAAFGTAACAGYGLVAAALMSLLPRAGRLLALQRAVRRRPAAVEASWWPLELLAAALRSTPTLRRTLEEFNTAVSAAVGQARTILADRLWPAWVAAFIAPVLGLMTAWHNGAQVQMRMNDGTAPAQVVPAFIAQVSPPMVATIAASLALVVAIVALDQWTKILLVKWRGIVEATDGNHPAIIERLSVDAAAAAHEAPRGAGIAVTRESAPRPPQESLPITSLDPDNLEREWRESTSRRE
jgi:hypothetical protein